jgi:hypothetical protein
MAVRGTRIASDRRRGPDIWAKMIGWLGVVGWLVMLIAMFIAEKAQPHFETFFDRWFKINVTTTWNVVLARYIFYLMILGFCISVLGLLINTKRHRRKYDDYRAYLVLLGLLSLVGMIKHIFF